MLSVASAGLTAGICHFPPNVVSITAGTTAKEPPEFKFQVTGIAVLSGIVILACFMEAFRALHRARDLQDRITRRLLLEEDLSPEEIRLIEQGTGKGDESGVGTQASKWWPRQLRLAWPARPEQTGRGEAGT